MESATASSRKGWCLASIDESPSCAQGMPREAELATRTRAARSVYRIATTVDQLRKFPNSVKTSLIAAATIYTQRFYSCHAFQDVYYKFVAAAALWIAAKMRKQWISMERLSAALRRVIHGRGKYGQIKTAELAKIILEVELCVLQTLGFDLAPEMPPQHALHIIKALIPEDVAYHKLAFRWTMELMMKNAEYLVLFTPQEIGVIVCNAICMWRGQALGMDAWMKAVSAPLATDRMLEEAKKLLIDNRTNPPSQYRLPVLPPYKSFSRN